MVLTFIFNLIIIFSEIIVFSKLKNKKDIFKYYTYLQNFISLIISIITCFYILYLLFDGTELYFIRGLRYISCCGLITTMFVYLFLSTNKDNCLSSDDFKNNFNFKIGDFLLHYFCPIISVISFIFIERWMKISSDFWTIYATLPSVIYFILYGVLSYFKLWNEPYNFKGKSNNNLFEILSFILIPVIFIIISFVLWSIK